MNPGFPGSGYLGRFIVKMVTSYSRKRARVPSGMKKKAKRSRTVAPTRAIMSPTMSSKLSIPINKNLRTTLRYYGQHIRLDPSAGGIADSHVFSANGCYDPDVTSTGHQPMGFDQLMPIYDHYTVIGAKIQAEFHNTDSLRATNIFVAVRDDGTASVNPLEIVENGYVDRKLIGPAGANDTGVVKQQVDIAKFLGRSDALADNQLKGSSSANPNEGVYFLVGAIPLTTGDPGVVDCQVIIEYDVIFHERKMLGTS